MSSSGEDPSQFTDGCLETYPHMQGWQRERERVHVSSSYGGTNLIMRAPPLRLCLNLTPKDAIPNTIIPSVRVSAYESCVCVCVCVCVLGWRGGHNSV